MEDVLLQLKFNLDLESISTHALFRVVNNELSRLPLQKFMKDVLRSNHADEDSDSTRILMKSWICESNGIFENSALQEASSKKISSTSVWLKYLEESYMVMLGKYILSEEESVLLGCLRMQVSVLNLIFEKLIH